MFFKTSRLQNNQGLSMIELIIGCASAAVVSLAIATILTNLKKTEKGIIAKSEQRAEMLGMQRLMSNKLACTSTFTGMNPVTGATISTVGQGLENASGTVTYAVGAKDGSGLLSYEGFTIQNYVQDPTIPLPTKIGRGELLVRMKKVGTIIGASDMNQTFLIHMALDASNNITECFLFGIDSDSFWQITPTDPNNIYYNAGLVGIGTDNLTDRLEVSGTIRASAGALGYRFAANPGGGGGDVASILYHHNGERTTLAIFNDNDPVGPTGDEIQIGAQGGIKFFTDTVVGSYSQRMIINSAGNVGIGATAPRTRVDVNGEIATASRLTMTTNLTSTSPTWSMDNFADRFRIFRQPNISTAGSEFVTVTNAGDLGIGTATPLEKLHVVGNIFATGVMEATVYHWTSDLKLKNIISKAQGLNIISKLNGYKFSWKKDGVITDGVMAQEVQKTMPELVSVRNNIKSVNYMGLVAPLIESIKELQAKQIVLIERIEQLEKEIAAEEEN